MGESILNGGGRLVESILPRGVTSKVSSSYPEGWPFGRVYPTWRGGRLGEFILPGGVAGWANPSYP